MPLFVILAQDAPDTLAQRVALRPAHLERLQGLANQNRLVLAGPMPMASDSSAGFLGSLIVAEFADEDDAKNWLQDDPFVKNAIYASTTIYPFIKALP